MEIKAGHYDRDLENQFWTFSPEPKGQLTRNLIGSIEAT